MRSKPGEEINLFFTSLWLSGRRDKSLLNLHSVLPRSINETVPLSTGLFFSLRYYLSYFLKILGMGNPIFPKLSKIEPIRASTIKKYDILTTMAMAGKACPISTKTAKVKTYFKIPVFMNPATLPKAKFFFKRAAMIPNTMSTTIKITMVWTWEVAKIITRSAINLNEVKIYKNVFRPFSSLSWG
jgi:hypothetical protein